MTSPNTNKNINWRDCLLGFMLAMILFMFIGQQKPAEGEKRAENAKDDIAAELKARKISIVDAKGTERIKLGIKPETNIPFIILRDAEGTPRLILEQDGKGNSAVVLVDSAGAPRGILGSDEEGRVYLSVRSSSQKKLLQVRENADGLPHIMMADSDGAPRMFAQIHKTGEVTLEMRDSKNRTQWTQAINAEGMPGTVWGPLDQKRITIGITREGLAGVGLFRSGGITPTLQALVTTDGVGFIGLYDKDGKMKSIVGIDDKGKPMPPIPE